MARRKVKLAFIMDNGKRKATYMKRKKGLLNKVSEISTLCCVNACGIIYSPYHTQPEVWPSNAGVQQVISQFKSMPETMQSRKMLDQESFLRLCTGKVNEQLKKQKMDNREKDFIELIHESLFTDKSRLQNLGLSDLNDLGRRTQEKLQEINKKLESTKSIQVTAQQVAPPPPPLPPAVLQPPTQLQDAPQLPSVPLQPPMGTVTNNQMQAAGTMQVQDQNDLPQWFMDWINHPVENMGFCDGGEEQIIIPFTNNPSTEWPNASYGGQGSEDHANL